MSEIAAFNLALEKTPVQLELNTHGKGEQSPLSTSWHISSVNAIQG
jgi:hypothetical protein